MLYDAINVFEKMLKAEADKWQFAELDGTYTKLERKTKLLVDNYVLAPGTYVLINMDEEFCCKTSPLEVRFNKEYREDRYIKYLDYNSRLISTQKPISNKNIHSNQIYSFFIKKEKIDNNGNVLSFLDGKIDAEHLIDGYYDALLGGPKDKKDKELYRYVLDEIGVVDIETLEKIRKWMKVWIKNPQIIPVDYSEKGYLKLFFVYDDEKITKELFEKENKRYTVPKIYNSNNYNIKVNNVILGVPSNNANMNDKKPFLENKDRKISTPYLIDMENAILQRYFFDYLWGYACKGECNVYIDFEKKIITAVSDESNDIPDVKKGMYLRIVKINKPVRQEAEIVDWDTVINLNPNLVPTFCFKEIIEDTGDKKPYNQCDKVYKLEEVIDQIFFDGKLRKNYFTDSSKLSKMNINGELKNSLLTYRGRIFTWLHKMPQYEIRQIIQEMALKRMQNKIVCGHMLDAKRQLNLLLSLESYFSENNEREKLMGLIQKNFKEHMDMQKEEWDFSDEEYYYAVGQLVSYFLSLSESGKKPLSMANQFLNANSDKFIKEKLSQMFIRYDHAIDSDRDVRAKNVISHIMLYKPKSDKIMQEEMIAGLTANIAFYRKKDE